MDFDDVNFKLICAQETLNTVQVHMAIKGAADLKKCVSFAFLLYFVHYFSLFD
jgi:hypothetical protein